MEKSELFPHVLDVLRREPQTHLNAVEYQIRRSVDGYERRDALYVQEIIWDLLVQGVLAPGKNSLNLNLPFFHVTPYGRDCLESGAILLHDPHGYLAELRDGLNAPLDPTIEVYAREGQRAFQSGSHAGAIALLGLAAKRCLDLLEIACSEEDHGRSATREEISGCLARLELPDARRTDLERRLEELFILVGHSQDQNGRPIAPSADRATAQAHFLLFPPACRAVHEVIAAVS